MQKNSIISHTGATLLFMLHSRKTYYMRSIVVSGVGLLLMGKRWEVCQRDRKEGGGGRLGGWSGKLLAQVLQIKCLSLSVELHSVFQAHLSISLPFFSFPIFPSIILIFLQHIAASAVTSFFPALFIFRIHLFFSVPVLSSWCLL